ncbi:MAG: hypothetical protein NTV51_27520 [Verrucomicrobia bacterium]|nr:hypothetical protein [Verrucomicrobiota bacterium]
MEKPWKVIVAFIGVFIAGSVFGGLLALRIKQNDLALAPAPVAVTSPPATATVVPSSPAATTAAGQAPAQPAAARPNPPPLPQVQLPAIMVVQAPQLMRRYVDRLDLTPEQKERIHPLIVRATNDLSRQKQTNLRETGIIIQHLQEDLAKELTVAQRGRLEEMAEHQRQIIEAREKVQQDKMKAQQPMAKPATKEAKPGPKDAPKPKAAGKPVDDGN